MASDSEIRAWAVETGRSVSSKGRVAQGLRDAYSAAHNGQPPPAPDYPDGMTDADFETAEAELPDDGPDPDPEMAETPPRPVTPKASSRSTGRRLAARLQRGKTSGGKKPKPKHPRVSTADVIGSAWRIMATIARPLPPMQRTLRLQSVIAGPVLDPAVKGTFIDPLLQVAARHYQAGEAFSALVAPNLGIGAATWHLAQCARAGVEPNPIILQGCAEVTRYGLVAMMRIGGPTFAAQMAREKEDAELGMSVDAIMEWIMSPAADPATEDENAAEMAARFAGQPTPEPAAV